MLSHRRRRWRLGIALLATVVVLAVPGWFWGQSLMPSSFSVLEMGVPEYGGGPEGHDHHQHAAPGGVSVTALVADPDRPADATVDLVARQQEIRIGDRKMPGFTLNGRTPGRRSLPSKAIWSRSDCGTPRWRAA